MKLTMAREGQPPYEVTVPQTTMDATDAYAQRIGLANTEHLICRILLDQVLCGVIIPHTKPSEEQAAHLAAIEKDAADAKAKLEQERLKPFLPELTIGGQVVTLPEIEAQLRAEREKKIENNG